VSSLPSPSSLVPPHLCPGCSRCASLAEYPLTTENSALYLRGDPYETSDAVFGVKESLIVDLQTVSDVEGIAEHYAVPASTRLLTYNFVLVTDQETAELRDTEARKAAAKQGWNVQIIDGVPVPEVD
jgi:hypothetical protein